jgi:hypothetical protein
MGSDQIVSAQFPARVVFERRPTAFTPAKSEEIASIHARSRGFHTMTRILWAGESRTDGRQPVIGAAGRSALSVYPTASLRKGVKTPITKRVFRYSTPILRPAPSEIGIFDGNVN